MELNRIIAEIDSQIAKLQQARALLSSGNSAVRVGPGRPKGSTNIAKAATPKKRTSKKRQLSAEGRKKIADAMKKRWAEKRKQAAKG